MGAGIQPRIAAPHLLYRQQPIGQIHVQQRCDFQFPPCRRLHQLRPVRGAAIQKIQTCDRIGRRRLGRFFDDLAHGAIGGEIHHAIAFGISHAIAEYRAALFHRIGGGQLFGQPMPKENIIAQHHRAGGTVQEILGQNIGLRQPVGAGLGNIGQRQAPLAAIAQGALELVLILRGGDHRDVPDAGQHQHRQRVINHRLVIDRQKLLRHAHRDRIQPRSRSARQNDPFACHAVTSFITSASAAFQSGCVIPKSACNEAQSSREFNGRRAGVG